MATIYDGTRIFNAADGAQALAADQNTVQDQLIMGLEARTQAVAIPGGLIDSAGNNWARVLAGVDPPRCEDVTANSLDSIWWPISVRFKEYITDVTIVYQGVDAGPAGGFMRLYYSILTTAIPAIVQVGADIGGANPWAVAGVVTSASITPNHTVNWTGAVEENRQYFVVAQSHNNGAGPDYCRIFSIRYTTRFHAGT